MKLPWVLVSRATYDRLLAATESADRRAAASLTMLRDERARSDKLTQQMIDLKREGFHPGSPEAPTLVPERKPLPDNWVLVEDAIADRAGGIRSLERQLRGDAHTMREAGLDAQDIAKRIYRGRGSE